MNNRDFILDFFDALQASGAQPVFTSITREGAEGVGELKVVRVSFQHPLRVDLFGQLQRDFGLAPTEEVDGLPSYTFNAAESERVSL